jgi:hypothetical protein
LIEDLAVDECTIHRASGATAGRWWQLWFHVRRFTDQQPDVFCVPVNPLGDFRVGPGGKTWGLVPTSQRDVWRVTPSINVLASGDAIEQPGATSLWHETPDIAGVGPDEAWAQGAPP